ncbi:MAG: hypothetical protein HYR73_05615 [Candidatus Eisenbacteria bacterium]|nr:hypothetical protein [Candidatus Eisenbacteria bacterium]
MSSDIRKRFARDVRALHRAELNQLLGKSVTKRTTGAREEPPRGRTPVLSKHGLKSTGLRAGFKGKLFRARVLRDGSIRFRGHIYSSPSLAGSAVISRSCNGWTFWTYQRAPGDWVRLDTLRR